MKQSALRPIDDIIVRRVSSFVEWASLEHDWKDLLSKSAADCIFLSWEWMDTWVAVYGEAGSLCVLVAETSDGQVVGIAPMMLESLQKLSCIDIRHLIMLGQKADTSSEYLDWIIDDCYVERVANAFCSHLLVEMKTQWDVMSIANLRTDSRALPIIKNKFGSLFEIVRRVSSPYVILEVESWDEYLNLRRAKFRQRWKRFHREHNVILRHVGRDISLSEGLEKLKALNAARWASDRQSFLTERYSNFHEHVARRLLARNSLLLVLMEVDGTTVAGRYDFLYGGKAWSFQGGWLPEWSNLSIGKLMIAEILRWCIENGIGEYDFLGGSSTYKDDWSSNCREMICVEVANPHSCRGRILRMFRRFVRLLRRTLLR